MNSDLLLKQISDHVKQFYSDRAHAGLVYHNLPHTVEVVDAAKKIAGHYGINDHDFFIICASAWFHDVGYLNGSSTHHEEKSAELATIFLRNLSVDEPTITEIRSCILATKMPQHPESLNEKILCDADLFHLGTDSFKEKSKLLRKEIEMMKNIKIDGDDWRMQNIRLLEKHQYHTDYCRSILDKTQAENLEKLKRKQEEKSFEKTSSTIQPPETQASPAFAQANPGQQTNGAPEIKVAPKPKKNERPIRGVETMFRVSSSNHQRLSVMADNKAHIMISVNSIIISVAIALVVRKLEDNKSLVSLIVPTLILLAVNVVTIIYAVLATRPRIPNGLFSKKELEEKTVNLLFFGSFYRMNFEDYEAGMRQMMNDSEFLYGSLIRDIYSQGKVLGRKYNLLHKSYNVFMYGIAITVIAYALAIIIYK
ncbi:MAG TPA: Pycsar system effector family protein [Puia sp.]|nr:Pycsar system effector family protein [Puia sp.]